MKNILSTRNIIIGLVLILIAFFTWNNIRVAKEAAKPVETSIAADDHFIGPAEAKVVVIEYADFQCPACKAFDPIVTQVAAKYSDRVKFVHRHFPLIQIHKNAMLASVAAEAAARQGKFWEMKKVLFEKQEEWGNALDANDKIISYATTLGLNVEKLKTDMADPAVKERVERDLKEASRIRLTGTPSFIINGTRVDTTQIAGVDAFSAYLDKELAK